MELFHMESLLKLLVATVLGAAVGMERGTHGRPAGLRTHAIVCLASTLLIVVSRTGALMGLSGPDNFLMNVDPARMGAGIVTGIGFLGAGAILRIGDDLIRGLTTAACIWFVAAIGIAVGFDAYGLAVVATVLALIILVLLDRLEGAMESVAYRGFIVEMDKEKRETVEQSCRELFEKFEMRVQQVTYEVNNRSSETVLTFSVRLGTKHEKPDIITEVAALPGVFHVKWH